MATRLLVVGRDRCGLALAQRAAAVPNLEICADRSADGERIWKLLRSGKLKPGWLLDMALAEWRRPRVADPGLPGLRTNRELLAWAERGIEQIYLFRAGLIVNREVIATFKDVLNVHCATIPAYGGVGAIPRALRDGAFRQHATLHRVTTRIDEGEVLATEDYVLNPAWPYWKNEHAAYDAGMTLLLRQLSL